MHRNFRNCTECPMENSKVAVRGSCLKCGFYKKKPKPIPVPFPEEAEPVVVVPDEEPGQ